MPTFQYTAMDGAGKEKRGKIEASSEQDAGAKLKQQGLFVTNISSAKAGGKRGGNKKSKGAKKGGGIVIGTPVIKKKKLTTFTRQIATLLEAGQALVRALRTLERQAGRDVAVARVLGEIADSVEGGTTFSEALAAHPKSFSKLYVNMVRAGEAAGQLDTTLNSLATFMEKAARISGKIKSAMAYPIIVLLIALVITSLLLMFLVPKFAKIFNDMLPGKDLPVLTQFVVNTSEILKNQFFLVAGIVIALIFLLRMAKKTKQGGYLIDLVFFRTPPFAALVVRSSVARVSRTLGTLMNSGVSVLQALQISAETSGNEVVARAIRQVHDAVKEGEGMSKPMEGTKVFPPICVSMVEVGEETGSLPSMLTRIADVYEEEVDRAVEALTSIIEPIMIVFLAVVVGTIVIAMFLPMISLMSNLGS